MVDTCGILWEYTLIWGVKSLFQYLWQSPLTAVSVSRKDKIKALAVTAEAVVYLLGLMKKQYIVIFIVKLVNAFLKLSFFLSPLDRVHNTVKADILTVYAEFFHIAHEYGTQSSI